MYNLLAIPKEMRSFKNLYIRPNCNHCIELIPAIFLRIHDLPSSEQIGLGAIGIDGYILPLRRRNAFKLRFVLSMNKRPSEAEWPIPIF